MNTTAAKAQKKIGLLKALIDHPRTGEPEREAARRMLKRVMDRARADGGQTDAYAGWSTADHRTYGAKYEQVKNMGLAEIAKLMREDVKLARKVGKQAAEPGSLALVDALGTMPAQIKVSITSQYYSGGGSIHVRVKNIPDGWGFVEEDHPFRDGATRMVPSPAFSAVLTDLRVIHAAYNYDGSDISTDYYDKNYLGCVDYERPYDRA